MTHPNPFSVTKAVDLTDAEIASTWVPWPGSGGEGITGAANRMPRFLIGGKGGGRTHAMRFASFELQTLRHPDVLAGLGRDGYIGIYFRCGGLNANRFAGKGMDEESWSAVFSFYMDVWLGRLLVDRLTKIAAGSSWTVDDVTAFLSHVGRAADLDIAQLDATPVDVVSGLQALSDAMQGLLQDMDRQINRAALGHRLDIAMRGRPGEIVFALPEAAAQHLPGLGSVMFTYLIDEFENLTGTQQAYVNTLIREKRLPTNIVVGSRRAGVKTRLTQSAGEENKYGSEFDVIVLEDAYEQDEVGYAAFCRGIIKLRLRQAGLGTFEDEELDGLFESPHRSDSVLRGDVALQVAGSAYPRPHHRRLDEQLRRGGASAGVVSSVVEQTQFIEHPLIEKFVIFRFYQSWARGKDLLPSAQAAREDGVSLIEDGQASSLLNLWKLWRDDLYAQLLADYKKPQPHAGLKHHIDSSGYLPRNLLIILKETLNWASFGGERMFSAGYRISAEAQRRGVQEAASWFLTDAKELGAIGEQSELAIRRLGGFLRRLRFSDKPVESSCCTFSTDRRGVSQETLDVLDNCVKSGLLLARGERAGATVARNSGALHFNYQLHPMIVSLFDLPLARRGVTPLVTEELQAIFDPAGTDKSYDRVAGRRLAAMNAPFHRGKAFEQEQLL